MDLRAALRAHSAWREHGRPSREARCSTGGLHAAGVPWWRQEFGAENGAGLRAQAGGPTQCKRRMSAPNLVVPDLGRALRGLSTLRKHVVPRGGDMLGVEGLSAAGVQQYQVLATGLGAGCEAGLRTRAGGPSGRTAARLTGGGRSCPAAAGAPSAAAPRPPPAPHGSKA